MFFKPFISKDYTLTIYIQDAVWHNIMNDKTIVHNKHVFLTTDYTFITFKLPLYNKNIGLYTFSLTIRRSLFIHLA